MKAIKNNKSLNAFLTRNVIQVLTIVDIFPLIIKIIKLQ